MIATEAPFGQGAITRSKGKAKNPDSRWSREWGAQLRLALLPVSPLNFV
jgi:hypothetical protein